MSEWIEIGTIVAAHGLTGEVRVYPNSDFPERFIEPGQRWLLHPGQTEPEPVEFLGGYLMPSKGIYVVEIEGIEDRNQAEALQGCPLLITDQDRPYLEEGEFYVLDLIGLEVFDQRKAEVIGKVIDVISAGNDLLEVELNSPTSTQDTLVSEPIPEGIHRKSKKKRKPKPLPTVLIPFVKEIVPIVDLEQKRIEITPPPGLIEETV
ncbi:ribosome maturation factor RimM [Planktothrix agardhii]|jgi:16S rRNA processing protein RimM|uniref:Ribosome maturation factor RimM n=2 Tax=Planktothrix agardhii TaxID=1160 RepID=A0A073CI25_PLAA1|nr:ribosome maturation factor RimM [Planktothrix agardhii]MCF3606662.1 ribosome maturation factor RimM [Planktothrix agardhii 1033]BBD56647.1 putative 16S rRNA processing protein [Planktothrix agardhii NIES-204]KEI67572.1 RimM [Planktothrix agardhii NIVA-CYA 126/8]MCB8750860.1 ribosome maturation factor RimM [Planktothrix agardhii 1810]MCB8759603.1 ribosome maturation factor RimM [Planktothrix agardhii 1813]